MSLLLLQLGHVLRIATYGGSVGLGIKALLADLGVKRGIKLKTDASAAKGIASRRGLGKVRHIEVSQLWLQEREGDGIKLHRAMLS